MQTIPLIEQIASLQNLTKAMRHCRRGKRKSRAYDRLLVHWPERLLNIRDQILSGTYPWQAYHEMKVFDPKPRDILVAPFQDRITHQAICQIIGPLIDAQIPKNSFACRKEMGNQHAVLALARHIQKLGAKRYTVKLDIRRYFESIDHKMLLSMLSAFINDKALLSLLHGLISSHPPHAAKGAGIPIGNVTSQHFANLYLSPLDRLAQTHANIFYIRYMDDMLICDTEKNEVLQLCHKLIDIATKLKLKIPREKTVFLSNDAIPFLGFVIDEIDIRPLKRNLRRFDRQIRRLEKKAARPSTIAEKKTSFSAWLKIASLVPTWEACRASGR
jgi:hypothetical protein